MLRNHYFIDGKGRSDIPRKEIKNIISKKHGVLWIDLFDPSDEELDVLVDDLSFHPLAIEDCIFPQNNPKIDDFGDHLFLVFHGVSENEDGEIVSNELDIFIGCNYIITVHYDQIKSINTLYERCRNNPSILEKGTDFLLHTILDGIVENYIPNLDKMDDKIDELEQQIFSDPNPKRMAEIFNLKKNIIALRKTIGPQQGVVNLLTRRDYPFIKPEMVIYFRDIYDNIVRIHSLLETYRDMLNSYMEAYLSATSNKLNSIMKTLTIMATFMMVITLVTSYYGMNVKFPEFSLGIPGIVVSWILIIIAAVGIYIFFKCKKWL